MPFHFAKIADSDRLKKMESAVMDRRPHTTFELGKLADSPRPSSDISELRKNGFVFNVQYQGKNENGRKIHTFQLIESPKDYDQSTQY
jgi:hypothetical protein